MIKSETARMLVLLERIATALETSNMLIPPPVAPPNVWEHNYPGVTSPTVQEDNYPGVTTTAAASKSEILESVWTPEPIIRSGVATIVRAGAGTKVPLETAPKPKAVKKNRAKVK